jgi:hypothetical protein
MMMRLRRSIEAPALRGGHQHLVGEESKWESSIPILVPEPRRLRPTGPGLFMITANPYGRAKGALAWQGV